MELMGPDNLPKDCAMLGGSRRPMVLVKLLVGLHGPMGLEEPRPAKMVQVQSWELHVLLEQDEVLEWDRPVAAVLLWQSGAAAGQLKSSHPSCRQGFGIGPRAAGSCPWTVWHKW